MATPEQPTTERPSFRLERPSMRLLPVDPGFTIQMAASERIVKGEDRYFAHRAHRELISRAQPPVSGDPAGWLINYDVFCVCDGHSGTAAANYMRQNLLPALHPLMPPGVPSGFGSSAGGEYARAVRRALSQALVLLNKSFCSMGILSGCTCTVAIVTGVLLTVGNVGDSDAILDCFNDVIKMTVPHRINDNLMERKRVKLAGSYMAAISMNMTGPAGKGEAGVGPLRIWPGGLCVSRGIGDIDVGDVVIAQPHVRQVLVPSTGARLVLASDGVWDCILPKAVVKAAKRKDVAAAATAVCDHCLRCKQGFLIDDTTCMIVDFVPYGVDSFKTYDPLKSAINGTNGANPSASTSAAANYYSPILHKGADGPQNMTLFDNLTFNSIAETHSERVKRVSLMLQRDAAEPVIQTNSTASMASEVPLQVTEDTSPGSSLHYRTGDAAPASRALAAAPAPAAAPSAAPAPAPAAPRPHKAKPHSANPFCGCFMPAVREDDDKPTRLPHPRVTTSSAPADASQASGAATDPGISNRSVRRESSTGGPLSIRRWNSTHGATRGSDQLPKVELYVDVDMAYEEEDDVRLESTPEGELGRHSVSIEEIDMNMGFEPDQSAERPKQMPLWHSMPPTSSDFTTRPHRSPSAKQFFPTA